MSRQMLLLSAEEIAEGQSLMDQLNAAQTPDERTAVRVRIDEHYARVTRRLLGESD